MKKYFLIAMVFMSFIWVQKSPAQVARLVHYQGAYQNSDGSPFNGNLNLKFSIYKSMRSEKAIWSETHINVEITDGKYEVLLGSVNPLKLSFYKYYLEVKPEGEETAAERVTIVGSGYNYRLNFLMAAYTIVWLAIFLYLLSISRRQKRIIADLETVAAVTQG